MLRVIWCCISIACFSLSLTSCSFLEIESPKSKVDSENVFSDDVTATAAILGIYAKMASGTSFSSGSNQSLSMLCGLSADELVVVTPGADVEAFDFESNDIKPANTYVFSLWSSAYNVIYQANAALEAIERSTAMSTGVKERLAGEALFVRAFCNFYLVNVFGKIPLIKHTDFKLNYNASRAEISDVYDFIIADLTKARNMIGDEYVENDRCRPNGFTVSALLARVYLYRGRWNEAERTAGEIIENQSMYALAQSLNGVFLANSSEAIWQLQPPSADGVNGSTNEAYFFDPQRVIYYNAIHPEMLKAFVAGDQRGTSWISSVESDNGTLYYPTKYRQYLIDLPISEYSMVFRLAEQYLIRAEARSQLGDLDGAAADLDSVRLRAGIPTVRDEDPEIDADGLLLLIQRERKAELFSEWGHRWFDLKRSGHLLDTLSLIKPSIDQYDSLYPVPQAEFNRNPALGEQNDGY
jgi:hypothetical protein